MTGRGLARKSRELIDACYDILEITQPATVRGVAYQLFTKGLIENMGRSCTGTVSRLLKTAREQEMIPWEWIVDETREREGVSTYRDLADFGETVTRAYRKDFWKHQPEWLMVISEKATVAGVIRPVLNRYAINFQFMHGYGSATALHDLAETSIDEGDERVLELLYIGDYDPSGLHMSEADLPDRIEKYGGVVDVTRIALLREDCTPLPSFPLSDKLDDPRHDWFQARYGETCWELDAMNPNELRNRLENEILARIDTDAWEHCQLTETAERDSYNRYIKAWPGMPR